MGESSNGLSCEEVIAGIACKGELMSMLSLSIVMDSTLASSFIQEIKEIKIVQVGKQRGIAKLMDAVMTLLLNSNHRFQLVLAISSTNKKLNNRVNKIIRNGIINVLI